MSLIKSLEFFQIFLDFIRIVLGFQPNRSFKLSKIKSEILQI